MTWTGDTNVTPGFTAPQQSNTALVTAVQSLNVILSKLQQTVEAVFPQSLGTAATATGGAATLPGNPVGFVSIVNPTDGTTILIPYYSP